MVRFSALSRLEMMSSGIENLTLVDHKGHVANVNHSL